MRVTIYKLTFNSGLHLGAHGVGTESIRATIPADTLFAALLTAWIRLGGDGDAWVNAFPTQQNGIVERSNPPFLITSAFPYAGGVFFFPKPIDAPFPDLPEEDRKRWKRVKFVSERIFFRLVAGRNLSGIWPSSDAGKTKQLKQNGAILVLPDEADDIPERVWSEEKIPRVTLDRVTSSSNLYSVGRVSFAKDAGLWFGMNWRDPERSCGNATFREAFEHALNELTISGLGGDRSAGQGTFTWESMDEVSWEDPVPGTSAILLSRYHPRAEELPGVLRNARGYSLERIGGWGASPSGQFRRRSVYLLGEGAVLVSPQDEVMGDLVDVSPKLRDVGHPVWRYGLAFTVLLGGAR